MFVRTRFPRILMLLCLIVSLTWMSVGCQPAEVTDTGPTEPAEPPQATEIGPTEQEEPPQEEEPAEVEDQPEIAVYAVPYAPITNWEPVDEAGYGIMVLHNLYETLLRYDPQNDEFIPLLATSYSQSEDGMTWTFEIREGVKFHDGTDLDAEAVRFSIQRYIDLGRGGAYQYDSVDQITTTGPYTVEFKLKYPAPLDILLSSAYAAYIVSPTAVQAHPEEWLGEGNEVGTGPYKLKSFRLGEEVVLEKFSDYWQGWEGDHFDIVVIKKVAEPATRRQMLERGEADVIVEMPFEDLEAFKSNPDTELVVAPTFDTWYVFLNTQKPPLDDVLVRQALSYAFPYDDVVEFAFGGYATQAQGAVSSSLWGHCDTCFQYSHDLEKAEELLTQAGYPDGGIDLSFNYQSGEEPSKRMAELYKAELAKLNVNLDIRGMPLDVMWGIATSADTAERQHMAAVPGYPSYADPYSLLYLAFHTEEAVFLNWAYYYNPEFDALIDEGTVISATGREAAAAKFVEAQEMLVEEAVTIFVLDRQLPFAINASFAGFSPNPAYPRVIFFYDTYRSQ